MSRVEIEAIVATSRPLPAYGGVQLADPVLEALALALRLGRIPMLVQHDVRRPMDAIVLEAEVREARDGYKEVWVHLDVDATDWETFDRERIAAGAPGGFSFACSEPLTTLDRLPNAPDTMLHLAADASHWSDDDLIAAAQELRSVGSVRVGRRYEFASDPAAVVVLELVISQVILGVLANALYDALRRFLRPARPTIFQFRVGRDGTSVEARLETDDSHALREAIGSFDQLVNSRVPVAWDGELNPWAAVGEQSARSVEKGPSGDSATTDSGPAL